MDAEKGPYYSRNKYILKVLEEHLNKNEQQVIKNLQGPRIGTPKTHAVATFATKPLTPRPPPNDYDDTATSVMKTELDDEGA